MEEEKERVGYRKHLWLSVTRLRANLMMARVAGRNVKFKLKFISLQVMLLMMSSSVASHCHNLLGQYESSSHGI